MKKTFLSVSCLVLVFVLVCGCFSYTANANVTFESSITAKMCKASYWYDKTSIDSNKILLTKKQIAVLNTNTLKAEGAMMFDLYNMESTYNATELKNSLSAIPETIRDYYIDGFQIDSKAYYEKLCQAIAETGYEGEKAKIQYAIAVKIANIKHLPTDDVLGYSANDPDDEIENSQLVVNEPFAIKQKCDIDGKTFYFGYSKNCSGWVNADSLAICSSKSEWYNAWHVEETGYDFIVVTTDKITLENSLSSKFSSGVVLPMGTVLKLVRVADIPENIGERASWYNYVVYLPTRNAEGKYERQIALISMHESVSQGYLKYTQKNVLKVAFRNIGDRYGWGGMLEALDCSLYTLRVCKCFGLDIPRNTTWQRAIPDCVVSMEEMTNEEKMEFLKSVPAGTLLYISGHTMIYTGFIGDTGYVISALGSVVDSKGEDVRLVNSIALNSLEVKRRNGTTWLDNLVAAVVF